MLGRGVVGGYIDSFEDQGAAAADIALEILAGKDPATLPRQTKPPHKYMVDANALKRWDIAESALPPGATSCSGSRPFGTSIARKSSRRSPLFFCNPP